MELSLSHTQSDDDDDVAPPSRGRSSQPNSPLFGDTEYNIAAQGGQLTSPPRSPSNILVIPSPTSSTHQNVPEEEVSNFIKYGCISKWLDQVLVTP